MLQNAGHQGIERTKSNVRSTMYWPNADKGINRIGNCNTCKKYWNSNPAEPLLLHEIPKDVWNKVATDLFVCLKKFHLIALDYTRKHFELGQLPNASLLK